jgi:hypothetical protein
VELDSFEFRFPEQERLKDSLHVAIEMKHRVNTSVSSDGFRTIGQPIKRAFVNFGNDFRDGDW